MCECYVCWGIFIEIEIEIDKKNKKIIGVLFCSLSTF